MTTGEFLLERLENLGLGHIVGVAGDFVLPFYKRLEGSKKIKLVPTTCESHAGFVADGYARVAGVGCVAVTYNVGALKLMNAIAGAYAEKSPVIVISGAPALEATKSSYPVHHSVGDFEFQRRCFKGITCAQAILDNPTTAGYEIDRVLEALLHYKQPVYIELHRDVSEKPLVYDVYRQGTPTKPKTDPDNLADAVEEVTRLIREAKRPVVLAGVEIARHKLGKELVKFIEQNNLPVAATLLSKSVVRELHPNFIGVYAGTVTSNTEVKTWVEGSDCLVVLGEVLTEATVGYRPGRPLEKVQMVTCTTSEGLTVRKHQYPNVGFSDFCDALFAAKGLRTEPLVDLENQPPPPFFPDHQKPITVGRLFEKINTLMDHDVIVVADTGDSLFGSADLTSCHEADSFLGPAFYLSMGFAIPAALGAKLARPNKKPLVLVGDGAFQMSLSEISTFVKNKLDAVFVVLNNRGYTTERLLMDGNFNDILEWRYEKVTDMMGGGTGHVASTEGALEGALALAFSNKGVHVINVILDPQDISPALRRMTGSLVKSM